MEVMRSLGCAPDKKGKRGREAARAMAFSPKTASPPVRVDDGGQRAKSVPRDSMEPSLPREMQGGAADAPRELSAEVQAPVRPKVNFMSAARMKLAEKVRWRRRWSSPARSYLYYSAYSFSSWIWGSFYSQVQRLCRHVIWLVFLHLVSTHCHCSVMRWHPR